MGNANGLIQTYYRASCVADVLLVGIALEIAQASVRADQIELRPTVSRGVFRHMIEMLENALHDQLLYRG
jgi:hypothetical protein